MVVELEVETKRFLGMLRAVSMNKKVPKVKLNFTPEAITTLNTGIGKEIIVKSWFSKNFFINYNVTEETEIGVNCEQVIDVVKTFDSNKIRMVVDGKDIRILGLTDQGKVHEEVKIPQIVVEDEPIPVVFFEAPFGEIVVRKRDTDEETQEVARQQLENYSHTKIPVLAGTKLDPLKVSKVAFEVRDGRLFLVQENEIGVKFAKSISEYVNNPKDGTRVAVNVQYVREAMRSFLSGEVNVGVGSIIGPLPLILCDKTSDWKIVIPIAPIIETEETIEETPE